MTEEEVLEEVIIGYRKLIHDRYQYQKLSSNYDLPATLTEDKLEQLRDYFLNHIYPPPSERNKLNEAFESLNNHIKYPEHLLRILLDSGSLIFKYGRHLPKILTAGIKALRSFLAANKFEKRLAQVALEKSIETPFSGNDVLALIGELPPQEVEKFIEESTALVKTIYDRKLIKKIINIVDHLIEKMRKRPNVYSEPEIEGLIIGREIIINGDALFEKLTSQEQEVFLDLIVKIERDMLDQVL